jgi:methyl-accepting chemotaxis protein
MAKSGKIKVTKTKTDEQARKQRIRQLKQEISKKASMANKRLKRLESNDLTNVPAYRQYVQGGGVKFSVKGKNYNQLQAELSRVNHFINSKTSTVRGTNSVLKEIANTAKIKYNNLSELYSNVNQFFSLATKVEDYLNATGQTALAIGYQRVWEAINKYVEQEGKILLDTTRDLAKALPEIAKLTGDLYFDHAMDDFDSVLDL